MPRRVIEFPLGPPPLPDKLPGEDAISRGVDHVLDLIERDPLLGLVNKIVEKIPIFPEKQYRTPFGMMKTPEFYIPKIAPARFDDRKREAFKAAVMQDLVSLVNLIPWVSDAAGPVLNAVNDTADAKIQDTLNPEEVKYFRSYNKVDPLSTIAMLRTMVRTQKEP